MPSDSYLIEPYGAHESQYLERWPNKMATRTAVLLHGGYWREAYGCDLMHPMAKRLHDTDWEVLNVEYRRVGQHADPWPAMKADVRTMLTLIPAQAVIIGHSAGGHLALWAGAQPEAPDLAGIVALAPVADLYEADRLKLSNHATSELLGSNDEQRHRRLAEASPSSLLPLRTRQLVVHGAADINVPKAISDDYVAKASKLGDDVTYLEGPEVDHFHIIDPTTSIWSHTEDVLQAWE